MNSLRASKAKINMDASFRWHDEQELDPGSAAGRSVLSLTKGRDDDHGTLARMTTRIARLASQNR